MQDEITIDKGAKGTYVLFIEMPQSSFIEVGALGEIKFRRGFYAYVGSAMGGLQARLRRHLRRPKKARWHIDYLVEAGKVKGAICTLKEKRLECLLAQRLEEVFVSIGRFGSSDCHCPSHLFFSEDLETLREKTKGIFQQIINEGELIWIWKLA